MTLSIQCPGGCGRPVGTENYEQFVVDVERDPAILVFVHDDGADCEIPPSDPRHAQFIETARKIVTDREPSNLGRAPQVAAAGDPLGVSGP